MAALGVGLGAGLGESGLTLGKGRGGHIIGGFFRVEVLLGDQLVIVEGLGAGVVELLLFEVRLRLSDVCLGGFFCSEKAGDIGVGGGLLLLRGHARFAVGVVLQRSHLHDDRLRRPRAAQGMAPRRRRRSADRHPDVRMVDGIFLRARQPPV